MNITKIMIRSLLCLAFFAATSAFAQTDARPTQADPCYEVLLQIVVASNRAPEKDALPAGLAPVVKKLKAVYAFSDYRLTTTFLQRTASTIKYKSLLNDFSPNPGTNAPVFSEWSLFNLKSFPGARSGKTIQFDSFRFGARVPVAMQTSSQEGKTFPVINYESIGIDGTRFSVSENEPTVIGSLGTSRPDELMFLVLTVSAAD